MRNIAHLKFFYILSLECLYTMCVPDTCKGQKWMLTSLEHTLELELWMFMKHHIDPGAELRLRICKSSECS